MEPLKPQTENTESSGETLGSLAAKFRTLENMLMWGLGAVIMTSFGANVFLAKQVRSVYATLRDQRPAVQQFTRGYRENDEPLIRNFLAALQRYSATNKEFQPIWEKYRPALTNYLAPQRAVPAPAAPPAPSPLAPAAPRK